MTINYKFYSLGAFHWLFSQVSCIFQLQGPIWRFVSKAGLFDFGRSLLVHFHLVDWKTHFSVLQGLLQYSNNFCRFCWLFLEKFDVFQLPELIWGFLSDASMFHFGRGFLVRFSLLDWKTHFSILQGLFKCFNIFFRFCWVFFAYFWTFPVTRTKLEIFEWCWYVWVLAGPLGTLPSGRLEDLLFNTAGVCSNVLILFLDFVGFFCRLLMFSNCWNQFGDFWVTLVCLTLGGVFWYMSIW